MTNEVPSVSIVDRQTVIEETEGWKLSLPEGDTWHGKLNNYHCYLPSDYFADKGGRLMAVFANNAGWMDKLNNQTHSPKDCYGHSELFLSQTPREFFNTIDQTIASLPDVSIDEINRLQRLHYEIPTIYMSQNMSPDEEKAEIEKIAKSMEAIRSLYEYTLSVYIDLRVKGYSHFDLTG